MTCAVAGREFLVAATLPARGASLIYFGGAQVALLVIYAFSRPDAADRHEHPLWPLVLAGLRFSISGGWDLILHLVFVWHRYIRMRSRRTISPRCGPSIKRRTKRHASRRLSPRAAGG